jgi:hypothetical protein
VEDGTMTSSREQEIKALTERCREDANRKGEQLERRGIEIMGKKEILEVFRLPIKSLRYNIRNGRFAAELRAAEAKEGRKLDTSNPEDATTVQNILLSQSKEETDFLKRDLKKKGQIDPGLITYDGYVINGNRRMAVFNLLYEDDPDPRFEYLDVQILPKSVTPKDLWRIEAGLQLSRDKRVDYSPINQLLKIEEGFKAGLKPAEIARSYYGKVTKGDITKSLERLKLMKEYLAYIGRPEQLKEANKLETKFINFQNQLKKLDKEGVSRSDKNKAIALGYEIMLGEIRHVDIRRLAEVILLERARDDIDKVLSDPDELAIEESSEEGVHEREEIEELELSDESRTESLSTDSLNYSKKKSRAKRIVEVYRDALDILDFEKSRDEPKKLINKAIDAIVSIDMESEHIFRTEVSEALKELAAKVMEFLEVIEEGAQDR